MERCSTDAQTDTSIPDQDRLLRAFALEHEMKVVKTFALDGVTGSIPGARDDVEKILRRKSEKDDFSVILVQDTSRFTRAGAEHGNKLLYDFRAAGIEVIFVADNLPTGEWNAVIKAVSFTAANQHAKSISFSVSRGAMSALEAGRTVHSARPIFGIDRLYVGVDGQPRHIIRHMPDGSQDLLDPTTRKWVRSYPGPTKKMHYKKQADERVVLVPGDPKLVDAVRRIFRWRLVEHWSHYKIASALNTEKVPTFGGVDWRASAIYTILLNTAYTGVGIANRKTRAVYNMRSPGCPIPAKVDANTLDKNRVVPMRIRDRAEWIEQKHPALEDMLDPEVKALAIKLQTEHMAAQAGGKPPKVNRDRHQDSPFFLKGILRSNAKHGNIEMSGRHCGGIPGQSRKYRYYALGRAFSTPGVAGSHNRLIPADALEQTVLGMVRDVLAHTGDLRERILMAVKKECEELIPAKHDVLSSDN